MSTFLNGLHEKFIVQKKCLLPDHEGGFTEVLQDIGNLWIKQEKKLLASFYKRQSSSYSLGRKVSNPRVKYFSARNEILLKAGMRLKGEKESYEVLWDAEKHTSLGLQQFYGISLPPLEKKRHGIA